MILRSAQFDDIYFSRQDGLAETRHVFFGGNNLPEAWQGRERFVIAETGFGTGLNFLAAWTMFEKTARPGQKLHFISFEKYPLAWEEMARALAPWRQEFGGRMNRLRALYPLRVPGFHRLMLNEQVTLTLIFDDVNEALPQLDAPEGVNAWFLDGFAPKKNPEMWTETVFSQMARLSAPGATCASFTSVGEVRRKLAAAGFNIQRRTGYGYKWHMLAGVFQDGQARAVLKRPQRVAIVGAGLAGTAAAFVLRRQGIETVIFEKSADIASGASGNPEGLYNPRLSALRTPESNFYTASWAQAVRTFSELPGINGNPCGSLHLATDEEREKKFRSALEKGGWHRAHMHWLDAAEASRRAGVTLRHPALFLPEAGTVSPAALCLAFAAGSEVRLSAAAPDFAAFDAVVLACGEGVREFAPDLPVDSVRGQMTAIRATAATFGLKTNLCFGGYLSPQQGGIHHLGATFQKWLDDPHIRPEDDADNIARLAAALPGLETPEVTGGRVGFRTASRDRFPLVGPVAGRDGFYMSAAHGSHGIVSALGAAHLLGDLMTGGPASLPRASIQALDPDRFQRRAVKAIRR